MSSSSSSSSSSLSQYYPHTLLFTLQPALHLECTLAMIYSLYVNDNVKAKKWNKIILCTKNVIIISEWIRYAVDRGKQKTKWKYKMVRNIHTYVQSVERRSERKNICWYLFNDFIFSIGCHLRCLLNTSSYSYSSFSLFFYVYVAIGWIWRRVIMWRSFQFQRHLNALMALSVDMTNVLSCAVTP